MASLFFCEISPTFPGTMEPIMASPEIAIAPPAIPIPPLGFGLFGSSFAACLAL